MSRLRVRVLGYQGSGKTTLIELLTERLRAVGIKFIVRGEEKDNPAGTTSERVEALQERETLVEIDSVPLRTPLVCEGRLKPPGMEGDLEFRAVSFRSFIFGQDEWWHPVDRDGKVYDSMRYDAEAVLSGYLPGVTIHIHSPEGS